MGDGCVGQVRTRVDVNGRLGGLDGDGLLGLAVLEGSQAGRARRLVVVCWKSKTCWGEQTGLDLTGRREKQGTVGGESQASEVVGERFVAVQPVGD